MPINKDDLLGEPNRNKGGRPRKVQPTPEVKSTVNQATLLLDARRQLYKSSYYQFFRAAFPHAKGEVFQEGSWYQEKLCRELQEVGLKLAAGLPRDKHLIINIPPRSAKSYIFNVVFPVWLWLHKPNAEILTITHGEKLAVDLVGMSKSIIDSLWFQELFGDLHGDQWCKGVRNETRVTNACGGSRKAFGIGANILGESADLILCDDIMDTDSADSNAVREAVLKKFRESIMSRFKYADTGVMINIQQRLHPQDVTGWILDHIPDDFCLYKLPSEAKTESEVSPPEWFENYDLDDTREDGTRLIWNHPRFFSRKVLNSKRGTIGSRAYAQQFLQTPRDMEGGMFKAEWFKNNIITRSEFDSRVAGRSVEWQLFIDGAETANPKNDATCYLLATKLDNQLFVLDVKMVRKEFPDLVRDLTEYLATKKHSLTPIRRVHIEKKSVGGMLLSQMKENVADIPFLPLDPKGIPKASRAIKQVPFCEGGRVHLIRDTWNEEFIEEVCAFTDGKGKNHDDALDALVYAIMDTRSSAFWWGT